MKIRFCNFYVVVLLMLGISSSLSAQTIWENHRSEVYPYLYRMAQKGLIEFEDIVRPVSRKQIFTWLQELENKSDQLLPIEKKELNFYMQEYRPLQFTDSTAKVSFGKKDANGRWRMLSIGSKDFEMHVDPILSGGQFSGNTSTFRQVSNGVQLWGQSKGWGFQLYYRDWTETGTGLDTFRSFSPQTGIIRVGNSTARSQNHSEIRGHISYSWKKASISLGKDQYLWGYGENGRLVHSDRAPSYAYMRFDYRPFKWMHFQYMHGWINSNIVDTTRTNGTGTIGVLGDVRILFVPKFIASHSLQVTPTKGLTFALGESIVYSDRMDPGFLIPFMLFKVYDNNRSFNNLNAGSNGQLFAQVSSRNHIKKTHLYATLFIDEIRLSTMFNPQRSRNQIGVNAGFSATDVLLPYLTVGAEYNRVNPFVYQNFVPAQNYNHHNWLMGDWNGANSDRLMAYLRYNPMPRLRTLLRVQSIRKGAQGSIFDQYFAEPQPRFLFDLQQKRTDVFFQATYEWINNLYLTGSFQFIRHSPTGRPTSNEHLLQIGITYGLQ